MDARVSHLHVNSAKSVAEYAYHEDKNFPTRKSMEDSIWSLTQIISLLMIFWAMALDSTEYLMGMEELKFLNTVPMHYPMLIYL